MSSTGLIGVCHNLASSGAVLFLQSGLVLLLGLGLATCLRRQGPFARSLALRTTVAAVVLTAFVSALSLPDRHPLWRISLFGSAPAPSSPLVPAVTPAPDPARLARRGPMPSFLPAATVRPSAATHQPLSATSEGIAAVGPAEVPTREHPVPSLRDWLCPRLVIIWGTGTACLLLWTVIGQISLIVLHRKSVPIGTGPVPELLQQLCPTRPPSVRASPHIRSPFLGGLWRPTVFLPASYGTDFDGPTLRAILAHETAHRDRNDNAWLLLTRLLCALLWVQPLCWLLARQVEQTAEEACDALALHSGCPPRVYADCLLSLAERLTASQFKRPLGAGVMQTRSAIGQRIQRVLQKEASPMSPTTLRLRLAIMLGVFSSATFSLVLVSGNATPATQPDGAGSTADKTASECSGHLKILTAAVVQYAHDHQGRLPDATAWTDEILPYVKDASLFHDPGAHPTQKWSYAYNQFLSDALLDQISKTNKPAQIVVVFDSDRNYVLDPVEGIKNASNPGNAFPRPDRHNGFNVFGFLDGHTEALPAGQKPRFRADVGGPLSQTVDHSRVTANHDTSTRLVFFKVYLGKATLKTEKARQEWLDFQRTHPVNLSKAQLAEINTLISLRLQRNGLEGQMATNAVIRAKHVARLVELGPDQEAERRKWQAEIKALDAQTLGDEQQMPEIERHLAQQEALVQPFADDYLEIQFKEQQYDIAQSENVTVRQVDASVWNAQKAAMLRERAVLKQQIEDAQKLLVVCEHKVKAHPLATAPKLPTSYPDNVVSMSERAKFDFVRAVHEHNTQVVAHWDAIARLDTQRRKVEQQQAALAIVDRQLLRLQLTAMIRQAQRKAGHSGR